jgi:hypothetical protein
MSILPRVDNGRMGGGSKTLVNGKAGPYRDRMSDTVIIRCIAVAGAKSRLHEGENSASASKKSNDAVGACSRSKSG